MPPAAGRDRGLPRVPLDELFKEAERQLTICNACRYCEGYCAVFPALELRRSFAEGDIAYLAHLCHDCRACYYACMYAPPHEFAVNIPQVLSEVRLASYERWSWPAALARAFTKPGIAAALAVSAVAVVVLLTMVSAGPARVFGSHRGPGSFYEVIPYWAMVVPGLAVSFYVAAIWLAGGVRFWLDTGSVLRGPGGLRALAGAAREALTLHWQRGGGPGCYYPAAHASSLRRAFHSCVVFGFLAAVASTTIAAIYQDLLDRLPPYSLLSAPVILGSMGGVGMIVGSIGLISLKLRSDPTPAGAGATGLDYAFLVLLGLASLSGMLTLAFRDTKAMGSMLAIHLGLIAALFVSAPYGKFVHFVYRYLAIVRHRVEQNQQRRSA